MYRKHLLVLWWLALLLPGTAAAEPTRFCVAADVRGHLGFASILDRMARLPGGPGQFIITPGDMDPLAVTRSQLDAALGKSFPWYPVVGNHETAAKKGVTRSDNMTYLREYYHKQLKGKVNPGPEGTRETTYSFDAGDVHIAIINQYWNGKAEPDSDRKGVGSVVEPLLNWLKKDLRDTRRTWKLVVGHEPAFPQPDQDWKVERHGEDALTLDPKARDAFWSVLEEQGVAVYLCAHTHRYSRYQPSGGKVWQIDAGQARGDKNWKYDTFLIVAADAKSLEFDAYRNLKERGKFAITDVLRLTARALPRVEPKVSPGAAPSK